MNNLAFLYNAQKQYEKSDLLYMKTLQIREKTLGRTHPSTLASVNNIAWSFLEQHKPESIPYFSHLAENWNSPSDWKCHWAQLGLVLAKSLLTKELHQAHIIHQKLVDILGESHTRVQQAKERIVSMQEYLSKQL